MNIETLKQDRDLFINKANHIQQQISQFNAEIHALIGRAQYCDELIAKLEKQNGETDSFIPQENS